MRKLPSEFKELAQEHDNAIQEESNVTTMYRRSNSTGNIQKTLTNLKLCIENMELDGLGFNEFEQVVTLGRDREPVDDGFISNLRLKVDNTINHTFPASDTLAMVELVAKERNTYHPVKQMIESKAWDQTPRVESLFIDYLGADDNEYTRAVAKKWLTGAVARIYQPAIKMEIVPVLEGKQGKGKSTLASKLGGGYFVDDLGSMGDTKDDTQKLIGSWIIELSELSSLKKTDTDKIKNFISSTSDKIRLPYGRIPKDYKRTSVFIGTTNNKQYLSDLTGNRRFFPVPLNNEPQKDVFGLSDDVIQQIWAEAKTYYDAGETLFFDEYQELLASEYRIEASKEDMFLTDIEEYLDMPVQDGWDSLKPYEKRQRFYSYQQDSNGANFKGKKIDRTTSKEIARVVFELTGNDRSSSSTMAKINMYMNHLDDWKAQSVRIGGKVAQGFRRMT